MKKPNLTKSPALLVVIILIVVILIALVIPVKKQTEPAVPASSSSVQPAATAAPKPTATPKVTIDISTLQDGLKDMGFLVTEEYYFTDVISYSSVKTLFNIELGFTESAYLASYDGVVSAGVDFTNIRITKNDDAKTITITIPKSEIYATDIDLDSLQVYTEKNGFTNPLSITDLNNGLTELKEKAVSNAEAKGVLDRADENAKTLIVNFVNSLSLDPTYTVRYIYK